MKPYLGFVFLISCWAFFHSFVWVESRNFSVDWQHDRFLKDGQPFRYISGSIHYFRVPHQLWQDRLKKMKFAGLNTIQTYVEWSSHEPTPGKYDFQGDNDLIQFLKLAQKQDLLVILRVGPYICAERDMGGLPPWLLKNDKIELRKSDPKFIEAVDKWLDVFLPKIKPLLYNNGGPIITVQIENEYGSYGCDFTYTAHLREYFHKLLGPDVVLFTTDGSGDGYLRCGQVPQVLATIDFGVGANVSHNFGILKRHQSNGPLINSEFYTGWIDYWSTRHSQVSIQPIVKTLNEMLAFNASVNIYVFHGGTNFDFKASSNMDRDRLTPVPTSYDYDSPISEAGDLTPKFYAIKEVIKKYLPVQEKSDIVPVAPKMELPPITMSHKINVFQALNQVKPLLSKYPISFEQADFYYGFMLYSTTINFHPNDPAILSVPGLRDRAQVFVDQKYQGVLSQSQGLFNLSVMATNPSRLDILVENQGRCSFSCIGLRKGIVSNVTIGKHILTDWKIYLVFQDWNSVLKKASQANFSNQQGEESSPASFYEGQFVLPNDKTYPLDSFLRLDGWAKGVAFLNGKNLGRYWPVVGPQITLYAPSVYFKPYPAKNELVLFELEKSPCEKSSTCLAKFVKKHDINGPIPN